MDLVQLPNELLLQIAGYLDKQSCQSFRHACKEIAGVTRKFYAVKHARVQTYTITQNSWGLHDDGQHVQRLHELLRDPDFAPAATALRVMMPEDHTLLRTLLHMTDELPGFRKIVAAFRNISELIIETVNDVKERDTRRSWIPGTILRTVAALGHKVTHLGITSPILYMSLVCVAVGGCRIYVRNITALPDDMRDLLRDVKRVDHYSHAPHDNSRIEEGLLYRSWQTPYFPSEHETLSYALDGVEELHLGRCRELVEPQFFRRDTIPWQWPGKPMLKSLKIDNMHCIMESIYHLVASHIETLQSLLLNNVMLTHEKRDRGNWFDFFRQMAKLPLVRVNTFVISGCLDAGKKNNPTPKFSLEIAGKACYEWATGDTTADFPSALSLLIAGDECEYKQPPSSDPLLHGTGNMHGTTADKYRNMLHCGKLEYRRI